MVNSNFLGVLKYFRFSVIIKYSMIFRYLFRKSGNFRLSYFTIKQQTKVPITYLYALTSWNCLQSVVIPFLKLLPHSIHDLYKMALVLH